MSAGMEEEKQGGTSHPSWTIVTWVTISMATISIALLTTAMATDHWIDTVVTMPVSLTDQQKDDPIFYPHYQGLFHRCYTGGKINTLQVNTEQRNLKVEQTVATRDVCVLEEGLEVFEPLSPKYDMDYVTRAHFLRATVGTMAGAIFLQLLAIVLSLFCLCSGRTGLLGATFACLFVGSLVAGAGLALFWRVYLLQAETLLAYAEFPAGWKSKTEYASISNSPVNYGWSFILGCVGAGFALLASIMALIAIGGLSNSNAGSNSMNDARQQRQQQQQQQGNYGSSLPPPHIRNQRVGSGEEVQGMPQNVSNGDPGGNLGSYIYTNGLPTAYNQNTLSGSQLPPGSPYIIPPAGSGGTVMTARAYSNWQAPPQVGLAEGNMVVADSS